MRFVSLMPLAALSLAVVAGCGSDTPDPNDPSQYQQGQYGQYPQGGYPPGQYGQPGQPGQYPQQGGYPQQPGGYPAPTGTAVQPAPTATAPAAAGGQATPIAPAAAAAATPILTALAAQETRGMQPEGGAFAAQFQQGQTFEQPINIEPGRCYTVVGVGIGITELDIQLAIQPLPMAPPQVLAQDNGQGPQAVLGAGGNCFKNPLPLGGPGKVIVKATGGSGFALAQIYKK